MFGFRPVFGKLLSQPSSSRAWEMTCTASIDSHVTRNGSPSPTSPVWSAGSETRSGSGIAARSTICVLTTAPSAPVAIQVDLVHPAEVGRETAATVTLDHHETVVVERLDVGHEVSGDLGAVVGETGVRCRCRCRTGRSAARTDREHRRRRLRG